MARFAVGAALALGGLSAASAQPWDEAAYAQQTEQTEETPWAVNEVAAWALQTGDAGGLPFVIVDKIGAQVFVYAPDGALRGASPVLIGSAEGDDSAPGVGDKELSDILPEERTTPAGRFVAAYGFARGDRSVLWVDFDTAISLHPVVTSNPREHRLERLASPEVDDNRITYGCINVPAAFYEDVVRPTFTGTRGVVYVLPETRPLEAVFPGLQTLASASAGAGSTEALAP
jgi:hypothetical protein